MQHISRLTPEDRARLCLREKMSDTPLVTRIAEEIRQAEQRGREEAVEREMSA